MPQPASNKEPKGGRGVLTVIIILIILVPFAYAVVSRVVAKGPDPAQVFLERPAPEHKECVRETEYMRYHHWELLRSTREQVVRYGIRGESGLKKCRECHTSRERFCDQCHNATSLTPDCWGCHYYP